MNCYDDVGVLMNSYDVSDPVNLSFFDTVNRCDVVDLINCSNGVV